MSTQSDVIQEGIIFVCAWVAVGCLAAAFVQTVMIYGFGAAITPDWPVRLIGIAFCAFWFGGMCSL